MESIQAVRRSMSHERTRGRYQNRRAQSAGERYHRSEPGIENLAPILMPSGLNSMLKNTTETGDIGLFSIKASRLPRHAGTLPLAGQGRMQRSGHQELAVQSPDFSLFRPPTMVDDRKQLPSYTRDVTSEIVSLYETTSQKSSVSSRFVDDAEQRSYSLTQSSVFGSKLANHRSYASLRSQVDQSLGQRPRSPFPYPTRLKRPGFRPSSPALTDGGAVDYSRRAEIGREIPLGKTPSTSTLIVKKRVPPPLTLRTDINNSLPGSYRHAPFRNRSNDPPNSGVLESALSPTSAFGETQSQCTSPARSNMSSDVAVERRFRSRASSSATVSKAPPPSPLYYDYSENFFPEDEMGEPNLQLEPMEVPNPPFYLERTIHEDRELSSDWSYLAMTDLQGRGFLASEGLTVGVLDTSRTHQGTDISYAGAIKASPLRSVETFSGFDDDASLSPTPSNLANHNRRIPRMRSQVGMLGLDGTDDSVHSSEQAVSPTVFRPTASGIWLANGKENSHNVHEAVEGADDNASRRKATFPFKPGHLLKVSTDSTYLPEELSVEKPDAKERKSEDDSNEFSMSIAKQVSISEHTVIRADGASCSLATPKCSADTSRAHQDGASRQGCTSFMDDGGNQQAVAVGQRSGFTATPNEISALRHDGHPQQSDIEIQGSSRMSKNKSDGNLKASGLVLEHSPIKARYLSSEYAIGSAELRKVERSRRESHQSSTSEILSPTPTYPARELHVKNSIPQLMKALPPLPLRETSEFMPSQPARTSKLQSKRPPPLQLDSCQKASNALSPVTPLNDQGSPSQQQQQAPATQPFLSRFKLKPRSPAIPPEPSPPTTRPWNLEESYPWNSAASDSMPSPGLGHSKSGIIAPKLRLRMAKRSITSLGTVRVNREGASTSSAMEDIGTPNDLFSSPSSGLAGMFRQVSKRFQSGENQRNDAAVINLLSAEDASTSKLQRRTYAVDSKAKSGSKALDQTTLTELSTASSISSLNGLDGATRSSSIKLVKVSAKKTPNTYINTASTTEKATLKGMFQASKNESVRRKISGLKAKATASFSRSSSRNSVDVLAGHKASSASGLLRTARKSPVRRTRRIKNKITIWFRGAKKSVLGCVRLRPGSESSGAAPSKATG